MSRVRVPSSAPRINMNIHIKATIYTLLIALGIALLFWLGLTFPIAMRIIAITFSVASFLVIIYAGMYLMLKDG